MDKKTTGKAINKKSMKNYRKWAEKKNPFLAAIYLSVAGSSQYMYELINLARKGKIIEGDVPLPKIKTWLKLYKNPKRIGKALFKLMSEYDENSATQVEILQKINQVAELLKNEPEKIKAEYEKLTPDERQKGFDQSMMMFEEFQKLTIHDLLDEPDEEKRSKFANSITNPELKFFFRVQAPCFMLYGTYPHILLSSAKSGDDEALEKLIRLDKSVIFEPKISEIIHQAQALKAQARMSMIKKAFISAPKSKMSMKKVKCLMGGLISYLSIKLNQKIATAEIKKLFDAIALDLDGDSDQDLENMVGEIFEKAIQRSRGFWDIILADK